jgi:outer membrane protein OmpA-like peptidoglycan-associated protein
MLGRKRGALIGAAGMLAVSLMTLTASAQEEHSNDGAAFLRAGVGPRYLAMGGAGTATATDVHAGYWNPAGLGWMRGWQIAGMYTGGLDFDRSHNYVGVGYGGEMGSIALSWINAGTDEIRGTDINGNPTSEFSFGENAIQLSLAKAWDRFAFGVTGKMVNQDVGIDFGDDDNVTGFGLDLGASLRMNRYFNLGIAAQDIFTEVGDAEEANDVPASLRIGGTLFPADGFTLAMDLNKVKDDEDFQFRGGAEYKFWLNEEFNASLRAGMDQTRFAGGFGVGFDWFNFDYAYVVEPEDFLGENHRLGILLKFGEDDMGPGTMTGGPDRDRDGIPDDVDKCPDQPEDFDGYMDTDGCPDLDNDGDGIPDVQDQCPNQAEDLDGFEDSDGCPDLDNDKDGILDKDDKCPNAAETFNGFEDTDGCPDEAPIYFPRVHINFKFGTAEISGADPIPTLEEVAQIMKDHPDIIVEVQGHTDNVGTDESNQILSQKRAQAVKEYLVRKGVPAERLQTAGFGESRPIDTNDTDLGRARNRRIEFVVVKR